MGKMIKITLWLGAGAVVVYVGYRQLAKMASGERYGITTAGVTDSGNSVTRRFQGLAKEFNAARSEREQQLSRGLAIDD